MQETAIRPLHAYLATVARNTGCECYRVGGVADHVHLAVRLARTITMASLVEVLKTSSSKWIKSKFADCNEFSWQRGYGAFSVGSSGLEGLRCYIDNQEQHHRECTFKDEYLALFNEYGIEFDERYLWD